MSDRAAARIGNVEGGHQYVVGGVLIGQSEGGDFNALVRHQCLKGSLMETLTNQRQGRVRSPSLVDGILLDQTSSIRRGNFDMASQPSGRIKIGFS